MSNIKENENLDSIGVVSIKCNKYKNIYDEWDVCGHSLNGRELRECPYYLHHHNDNIRCNVRGTIYMPWTYYPIFNGVVNENNNNESKVGGA